MVGIFQANIDIDTFVCDLAIKKRDRKSREVSIVRDSAEIF